MENEMFRILLQLQSKQLLADFRAETQKHEFQDVSDLREYSGIEWTN